MIGGIAVQRWSQARVTRDIRDAEGIAILHETELDWRYVEEQLSPLAAAKDDPGILQHLARIRNLGATL